MPDILFHEHEQMSDVKPDQFMVLPKSLISRRIRQRLQIATEMLCLRNIHAWNALKRYRAFFLHPTPAEIILKINLHY